VAKSDADNRADQLNPNNDAYYQSRGYDGRDDFYGDDAGEFGPYFDRSGRGPVVPSFEEKQRAFLGQKRKEIARNMTTSRAADILSLQLAHSFPDFAIANSFSGGAVCITVRGCQQESEIAQSVSQAVTSWLADRSWLIEGCVEEVELVFKDC